MSDKSNFALKEHGDRREGSSEKHTQDNLAGEGATADSPSDDAPAFQPVSESAPLDAASVLANFYGGSPPMDIEDGEDAPLDNRPSRPLPTTAVSTSVTTQEDEESLQDYMAEMMKRVRGLNGPAPAPVVNRPAPKPESLATKPRLIEAIDPKPKAPVEMLSELPQRKLPPEMTSDLTAMRALANQSAQTALDSHTRSRWLQAGWGKLAVAMCGLLAGLLLTFWANQLGGFSIIGGGIGFMVFLFWGLQAAIILTCAYRGQSIPGGKDAEPQQTTDTVEVETLP